MNVVINTIINKLKLNRKDPKNLLYGNSSKIYKKPGIYAIFTAKVLALSKLNITLPKGELIYIGSSKNLATRIKKHFKPSGTGFSTLRRTLGAILKSELNLKCIPRGLGKSEQDYRCYCFDRYGEKLLTDWMFKNLQIAIYYCDIDYYDDKTLKLLEINLIKKTRPILNLNEWNNPYKERIKALRKICINEAKMYVKY